MLDGINGFLCKVKNSSSLAKKIIQFINLDYRQKVEMGLNSRSLAEKKFDIKKVNEIYLKDLKNIQNDNKKK